VAKTRHKPALVEKRTATIKHQTITYTLRRSFRARRTRIEISQRTGLTVVVPRSYSVSRIPGLLKSKEEWISKQLAKIADAKSLPPPKHLEAGDCVNYLGHDLVLIKQENHHADDVVIRGNELVINPDLFSNGLLEPTLERWYRAEAAKLINDIARRLSSQIHVKYRRIVIRGQKTRWGSCSRRENLNFNWKLIMAPQPVVEYVVIHELLHLKEMNHSRKFWELVASYCPDWREHKKWLKQHEADPTSTIFNSPSSSPPRQLRLI